jgi:hypothetical protein
MSTQRPALLAAAIVLLGAACRESTAPLNERASVVVQRDTLTSTTVTGGTMQWIHFTVPVAIHNTTQVPQTFDYCASSIETQVGGTWTRVWSPYCLMNFVPLVPILPGETRSVNVVVDAAIAGPGGPPWEGASVNGTYRYAAWITPVEVVGTVSWTASNAFILRQGL